MTDLNIDAILKKRNVPICIDKAECPHKIYRTKGYKPICSLPFLDLKSKECKAQRYPDAKEKVSFT